MYKIHILSVGKTKDSWLHEAMNEYINRLISTVKFEFNWVKDDDQLMSEFINLKSSTIIALDPKGKLVSSEDFSKILLQKLELGGSRLTFVIGGSDGLPQEVKNNASLISLSPMTFTHQLTRLILIEQIYRAFEIHKGSKYHK